MLGGIPLDALGIGSGWALVAVFVLLIYRGNLIPRRTYDDIVHDRDEWRAAHRISEAARVEGEDHRKAVAEGLSTMTKLLSEMQHRHRGARTGGEAS